MNRVIIYFTTIVLLAFTSCTKDKSEDLVAKGQKSNKKETVENNEKRAQVQTLPEGYDFTIKEYEDSLYADLSSIAQGVEQLGEDFSDSATVLQVASNHYNSSTYSIYEDMYHLGATSPKVEDFSSDYSEFVISKMSDIVDQVSSSDSHIDALSFLDNVFNDIDNDNQISSSDKEALLLYISSYRTAIDFMVSNQGSFKNAQVAAWWSNWGKCAAAIVGGAATGALTGAIGASAAPGVGTLVGAVLGGIGGGLTAAVASC
jgi:hypothetical protein